MDADAAFAKCGEYHAHGEKLHYAALHDALFRSLVSRAQPDPIYQARACFWVALHTPEQIRRLWARWMGGDQDAIVIEALECPVPIDDELADVFAAMIGDMESSFNSPLPEKEEAGAPGK